MSKSLPGEEGREAVGREEDNTDLEICKITHLARGYSAATCLTQERVSHPKAFQK